MRPPARSSHPSAPAGRQLPVAGAAEVLDSLPLGVVVVDASGQVLRRNALAQSLLPHADQLSSLFASVAPVELPVDHEVARGGETGFPGWPATIRKVIGQELTVNLRCTTAISQTLVWVQCGPLRTGEQPGAVLLIEPLAETPSDDRQREMSRRLASLGKLAARVAHELNNPLDGILRYINLALRIVGDAPESKLKAYLSETRTGVIRMVTIIGDLLEYSRATAGEFDDVGINEVIDEAIRSLASAADERRIVVAVDFQCSTMPKVRGSRLYQVLCNLIRNALDAMPGGGRLTITSGIVGNEVVIRVADTGVGLPEPVEKVFEPFFTTKPPGQGTGLGLAICKDFIEDMGGMIIAAHGATGGAMFTVRIPHALLEEKR